MVIFNLNNHCQDEPHRLLGPQQLRRTCKHMPTSTTQHSSGMPSAPPSSIYNVSLSSCPVFLAI